MSGANKGIVKKCVVLMRLSTCHCVKMIINIVKSCISLIDVFKWTFILIEYTAYESIILVGEYKHLDVFFRDTFSESWREFDGASFDELIMVITFIINLIIVAVIAVKKLNR